MSKVALPPKMEPAQFKAQRFLELPGGKIPLVGGPNDPVEKQVQERLIAHIKQFDLSLPDDVVQIEQIWQLYCDGAGFVLDHRSDFDPTRGRYLVMVRWVTYEYLPPSQPA